MDVSQVPHLSEKAERRRPNEKELFAEMSRGIAWLRLDRARKRPRDNGGMSDDDDSVLVSILRANKHSRSRLLSPRIN